ncbi:MAG: hypothetical protein ACYTBZ_26720, partial [Planctomycetota bacterium]
MSKKLYFLMCFVLVLALSGAAQATAIDDCRYNLSFELLIDPCDANSCDFRVCGHTSTMDDVLAWEMSSSFAGVDVNVGHTYECYTGGDERDWGIFPDGNAIAYMQSGKYIYQVLNPAFDGNAIIQVGRKYTLTFDATVNSDSPYDLYYSLFYGDNPEANEITIDVVTLVGVPHPGGKTDWTYDLTLSFVSTPGPSIGKTLGIKFDDRKPSTWLFVDDVRLDWVWATSAYGPSPADGAEDVPRDANLVWTPGGWADKHIVYFSDDFSKVSTRHQDANQGIQDVSIFDPTPGGGQLVQLVLGKTYYWSITEVNDSYVSTPGIPDPPWEGDVWSFEVTGLATNPNPENRAQDVSLYTNLSWTPGTESDEHDVYFGTLESEVTDANIDVNFGVYMGRQDANDFNDFVPAIELGKTYYWRIDEANEAAGTLIKGNTWSFTLAEYLSVDDFDSYVDHAALRAVWKDYWADTASKNGAQVFVETDANYTRSGQSMRYYYVNNDQHKVGGQYVGSETEVATADLAAIGSDWTDGGAEALVVYFIGDPCNGKDTTGLDQDQMYVAVEDIGTNVGIVLHPDMNVVKEGYWHEWNIELDDPCLSTVDLNNVAKFYIGFGGFTKTGQTAAGAGMTYGIGDNVYFDDIRLYPPRCRTEIAYFAGSFDYDDDCVVNHQDLHALTGDYWLKSGIGNVTASAPDDSNLVGHWPLDDANSGGQPATRTPVSDVSGNGNHGQLYDPDNDPGLSTGAHH